MTRRAVLDSIALYKKPSETSNGILAAHSRSMPRPGFGVILKSTFSRTRLGLSVGSEHARLIALAGGELLWAVETPITNQDVAAALRELFRAAPLGSSYWWPRLRVVGALSPSCVHTKRLIGLPTLGDSVRDADLVAKIVQANVTRFFALNESAQVASGVYFGGNGVVFGAVFDYSVLHAIETVCAEHGVRLVATIPSILVLGRVLDGTRLSWSDGDATVEAEFEHARLSSIRRKTVDESGATGRDYPVPCVLRELGDSACRFVEAFGAATLRSEEQMTIISPSLPPLTKRRRKASVRVALAVAAFTAIATSIAPLARARYVQVISLRRLATLTDRRRIVLGREAELQQLSARIEDVAEFRKEHPSTVQLLGAITRVLPLDACIIAIHLDRAGGSLVALASQAARLPALVETVPQVTSVQILGPVTRERVGGQERDRVSIHFRWSDADRRANSKPQASTLSTTASIR